MWFPFYRNTSLSRLEPGSPIWNRRLSHPLVYKKINVSVCVWKTEKEKQENNKPSLHLKSTIISTQIWYRYFKISFLNKPKEKRKIYEI